jgi:hypothetical protein
VIAADGVEVHERVVVHVVAAGTVGTGKVARLRHALDVGAPAVPGARQLADYGGPGICPVSGRRVMRVVLDGAGGQPQVVGQARVGQVIPACGEAVPAGQAVQVRHLRITDGLLLAVVLVDDDHEVRMPACSWRRRTGR